MQAPQQPYAQVPGAPTDAKSAKAAAKAAKVHAKAMRPWYRKKRFIVLGVIVLIIVIVVAANAGKKSNTSASGGGSPAGASGASATGAPQGCNTSHPSYPDQQVTHDCVAIADGTVSMANTTVTATWAKTTGDFDNAEICATVTIKNHNNGTITYNELYWRMQTPSGTVVDSNAQGNLGSGDIVAGGTANGTACFDDPGTAGAYVGIYKPDPYQAQRGIWLFTP